jgi:protein-S-isoprenylcysteine O-methyltransferase Ste14
MNKETAPKHKGYHNRPDLVGEHKTGDTGQLVLLVIFLIVWIMDSFIFKFSSPPYGKYIPFYLRAIVSLIVLITAWIMARKGLKIIFGEKRDKPTLINYSVFKIVRHPIYLSAILLYLGLIILTFSVASFIVWIITIIFYFYISRYEEKILINEFGEEYKEYMKEVPMLLPCIFKKKKNTAKKINIRI